MNQMKTTFLEDESLALNFSIDFLVMWKKRLD